MTEINNRMPEPSKAQGDASTILSNWRLAEISLSERLPIKEDRKKFFEVPASSKPWPDKASCEAENRLKKMGIQVPWGYQDQFGEDFQVFGLRAGGIGVVFIVESVGAEGKRKYAAKTLQSFLKPVYLSMPVHQQEEIAKAFLEEALPWLEMGQHPHIVPVRLFKNIIHPELKRNVPFVFSEFMPMGSLSEYLNEKGKLDLKESLSLGIQLCDGLLHAYESGLKAHLDLKPDNIMIYDDGVFKVTDFSANVIGTPGYMAPEQVASLWKNRGLKLVSHDLLTDQRSDQFAVGLIILEALMGRHAFTICMQACQDKNRAMEYMEEGVGEIPDNFLPLSLRGILTKGLSSKPDERFEHVSEFKKGLIETYERQFGGYNGPEVEIDDSAECWFDRGIAFYTLGRFILAEQPFKEALERNRMLPGTELDQATCRMNLGAVYGSTSRYPEAAEALGQALAVYSRIPGTERQQATCTMSLGAMYGDTGRYPEAAEALGQALAIFARIPGTELYQADCTKSLGNVYKATGRYPEAAEAYERALAIFARIPGTESRQADCTMSLGTMYVDTGRYPEAAEALGQALAIFARIPGTELYQADCTISLGNVYKATGRYPEAAEAYERALAIFARIPGTESRQADCTMSLGGVHWVTGRYSEAAEALGQALSIYGRIPGTELQQAGGTRNLGVLYWATGRYPEAAEALGQALEIYGRIPGTERQQADGTMHLGIVYRATGRYPEAAEAYGQALAIYGRIPGTELQQAHCTMALGNVYNDTGRYPEAEESYGQALEIYGRIPGAELDQAKCLVNLAIFYQENKNFSDSIGYAKQALKLCEPFPPEATEQIISDCQKIFEEAKK